MGNENDKQIGPNDPATRVGNELVLGLRTNFLF
jgi:hypothetical protein